jgi:high-affinity nickel permease
MLTLLGWLLGLANGVRHALEPDHVAAISTLVAEQKSTRKAATFAAMWGLGHGAMLLAVGGTLIALRARMPERIEQALELGVALMLVLLGGRAIRVAVSIAKGHTHDPKPSARRPFFVGIMHGLAGSGALTALIASEMPTPAAGIIALVLYGLGAAAGMALLASLASVPLESVARSRRGLPLLLASTGLASLAVGAFWGVTAFHALTA